MAQRTPAIGADRDRAERADAAAGRGDGDEAGDRAGGGAERGEGAVAELLYSSQASMAAAVATWVLTNITAATPSSCRARSPR